MKRELAEAIVDALSGSDYEASIYEDYSGRGMYGGTTTGIVLPNSEALAIGWAIACQDDSDLDPCDLRGLHEDSMGYDIIVY